MRIYGYPCLGCLHVLLFLLIASVTERRQSDDIVVSIFLYVRVSLLHGDSVGAK